MKNLISVFIGIVDILGYSEAEKHIDQYGKQASSQILGEMYKFLDTKISVYNRKDDIHWIRYGDGYVFYSDTDEINLLSAIIKDAINLIALSLNKSIPLRIAITQGDLKIIDTQQNGLSITGSGWNTLLNLEKSLDWMGGWVYLPNYDNNHHQTITDLIRTTHLIIQQTNFSEAKHNFTAPFKEGKKYSKDKTWFLNWQKVLHQENSSNDRLIDNWWQEYTHVNINDNQDVQRKQKNSKDFAHYCNILYQSAKLTYFSKVSDNLKIEKIMDSN
jgi:hypothetical protein